MKRSLVIFTGLFLLTLGNGSAMATGKPEPAAWVVDPVVPGDNLPPSGRSLFDRLFASARNGKVDYDLPFPFESLLARVDAQLSHDPASPLPPAKRVLIPLGRSLQRTAAAPDYFAFPRVVVAADSPPVSPSSLLLKDRLYIGYQEKSAVLEVISYNEAAGRFEFQLVKDYRAGGTPQVVYANRTLCYACHQNGAPIFSRALWDETNANLQVAALLSAHGKHFYGIPPERGVDVPYAIDLATKRANGFALTQKLWQEGCGGADLPARRCRAGLLTAALRHALSDGRKSNLDASLSTTLRAEAARRWPGGLAIAPADIPNRNPVQGVVNWPDDTARRVAYSHVAARFEPLAPRAAQAVWNAASPEAIDQLVGGLAEFVAASDRQRLEAALAKRPAPLIQHHAPCRFETRASRWSVRCQPVAGETGPQLTATLDAAEHGTVSGGRLERLNLPGSGTLNSIALSSAAAGSGERFALVPKTTPGQSQIPSSHRRKPVSSSTVVLDSGFRRNDNYNSLSQVPRGADGNPLTRIAFRVSPNSPAEVSVVVDVRQEFPAIEQAVMAMADGDDGAVLFGLRPFPREPLFAALFTRLGSPPVTPCCQAADKLPPPRLEVPAVAPGSAAATSADPTVRGFYPYCAACHQSAETFPPNFLTGSSEQVAARLRQCAPRLYVRLAMADLAPERRDKTPMPPESLLPAFATDSAGWRTSPARAALLAQVGDWLRTETGKPPTLTQLLADGYEALRPCLPASPPTP